MIPSTNIPIPPSLTTEDAHTSQRHNSLARLKRAGVPNALLVPCLPFDAAGIRETDGKLTTGNVKGKAPAYLPRGQTDWRGAPAWEKGIREDYFIKFGDETGVNAGMITGSVRDVLNIIAMDLDFACDTDADIEASTAMLSLVYKRIDREFGYFWFRRSRPGRGLVFFQIPQGEKAGKRAVVNLTRADGTSGGKVETLAERGMAVVAGIHAHTGKAITWVRSDTKTPALVPDFTDGGIPKLASRAEFDGLLAKVLADLGTEGITNSQSATKTKKANGVKAKQAPAAEEGQPAEDCGIPGYVHLTDAARMRLRLESFAPPSAELLISALDQIPNDDGNDRDVWVAVNHAVDGCIVGGLITGSVKESEVEPIKDAAIRWSCKWPGGTNEVDERKKWDTDWSRVEPKDLKAGWTYIRYLAAVAGLDDIILADAQYTFRDTPLLPAGALVDAVALVAALTVEDLTETATAKAFSIGYTDLVKYDKDEEAWHLFDPAIGWVRDPKDIVKSKIRVFCDKAMTRTDPRMHEPKLVYAASKISFSAAVERDCKYNPLTATSLDDWNADPYVLGYPGGHIDLRTGVAHPAEGRHMIRDRVTVAPSAEEDCPIWLEFLRQATGGVQGTLDWHQRYMGYLLTGTMIEEVIAFWWGPGGNGKGVALGTLLGILGSYSYTVPADLFKATTRLSREYYMAKLVGKRLILANELEAGAALAESFVKELTGNEGTVNARNPAGQPFLFKPTGKLLIVGNHQPKLQGRTDAMVRRLRMAPWTHKPEKPDVTLKDRLVAERPGILRWLINGCLKWQKDGLGMCEAVKTTSAAYFDSQDLMSQWLDDRCVLGVNEMAPVKAARDSYNDWLRGHGEMAPTRTVFEEAILRKPGISRIGRKEAGEMYGGFRLLTAEEMQREFEATEPAPV